MGNHLLARSRTASLLATILVSATVATAAEPAGTIEVAVDPTQPAGLPVSLRLTVRNTGDGPMSYWNGGPGAYPPDRKFEVMVTDAQGRARELVPFNGQYAAGSGRDRQIGPGEAMAVPLLLDPLPPGEYTLAVASGRSAYTDPRTGRETVTWPAMRSAAGAAFAVLVGDADSVARAERAWVDRVVAGEVLARLAVRRYPRPAVIAALYAGLSADSDRAAFNAAQALRALPAEFRPNEASAHVARGLTKAFGRSSAFNHDYLNGNLMAYLSDAAGELRTDDLLPPLLALAESFRAGQVRARAVRALGEFEQPEVVPALRRLLGSWDDWVAPAAALALADRGNPAAVPVLCRTVRAPLAAFRPECCRALARFPHDPRSEEAVRFLAERPEPGYEFDRRVAAEVLERIRATRARPPATAPASAPASRTTGAS